MVRDAIGIVTKYNIYGSVTHPTILVGGAFNYNGYILLFTNTMVKAITGIYHHGQVELNELPSNQSEPLEVVAIFLEPGESIPPELAQFLTAKTPSPTTPNSKPLPDMASRLAKLQEFITTRAQQQPSPEAAAFFERFQEHFDAERELERKLFHQHEQI